MYETNNPLNCTNLKIKLTHAYKNLKPLTLIKLKLKAIKLLEKITFTPCL